MYVNFQSAAPATATVQHQIRAMVATTDKQRYPFVVDVLGQQASATNFEIRQADVVPTFTTSFDLRLTAWLRGRLGDGLGVMLGLAEAQFKRQGYRA